MQLGAEIQAAKHFKKLHFHEGGCFACETHENCISQFFTLYSMPSRQITHNGNL